MPTTDGQTPESISPRQVLRTWWGKLIAALSIVGLLNGVVALGGTLSDWVTPRSRPSDASLVNRQLPLNRTPTPEASSPVLGHGDAVGGRPPVPFVQRAAAQTPVLNSFVDLKGVPDERKFMTARLVKSSRVDRSNPPFARIVTVPRELRRVWVRIMISNDATDVDDCHRPRGERTATNVRLRLRVWSQPRARRHVVRGWILADNAYPSWVTDAVLVLTPSPTMLRMDPKDSSSFRVAPAPSRLPVTSAVAQPGGMLIGRDGLLGSCFDNRVYLLVSFRLTPA